MWPLGGHLQWSLATHQRSKFKMHFFASCISKHRFCGVKSLKMTPFLLFDLSEVIYNDLSSEVKIQNTFFVLCMSNHRFCGMKSSKITPFHYFDLSEVKWPLTSNQSKFKLQVLHHLPVSKHSFWWVGITSVLHFHFRRTSWMTFDLWSDVKFHNILLYHVYLNVGFSR